MKKFSFIFLILIFLILIFILQNANTRDTVYIENPDTDSYVLWRVRFKQYGEHFKVRIDSVLRGNFFIDIGWKIPKSRTEWFNNLKTDTNYLVLSKVVRLSRNDSLYGHSTLLISEGDIFSDTPENREKLSKRWDKTKILVKDRGVLQKANVRDGVYLRNPSRNSYVLWRVQFQPEKDDKMFDVKIDSILRGNFFIKNEECRVWKRTIKGVDNLEMNTNYLVLTSVLRFNLGPSNLLYSPNDIFPDTPENRDKLSKRWDETIILFENPNPFNPEPMEVRDIRWLGRPPPPPPPSDTLRYAVIKVTIKNPKINKEIYPDSVLNGKIFDKDSYWIYNPALCPNLSAGEYIVLSQVFKYGPMIWGKCPLKDTEKNRQILANEWKKCQTWGEIKNRKSPPEGQLCGEIE